MPDHLRRDRRFIDEHEVRCVKLGLFSLQLRTRCSDIGAILFSRVQSFF